MSTIIVISPPPKDPPDDDSESMTVEVHGDTLTPEQAESVVKVIREKSAG